MAKHIDLSNILSAEKPTIKIGDKTYTVNDEKSTVLAMNSKIAKMDEIKAVDAAIEMLLGKDNAKEIETLHLSMSSYKELFFALVACVNNEDIEVVRNRFQKSQQ